jgi:hypothetical protein
VSDNWLGGSTNPNNLFSNWALSTAATHSGTISAGDYRVEMDYFQDSYNAYTALYSNNAVSYYSPTIPPNGVMPTTSFGSVT